MQENVCDKHQNFTVDMAAAAMAHEENGRTTDLQAGGNGGSNILGGNRLSSLNLNFDDFLSVLT